MANENACDRVAACATSHMLIRKDGHTLDQPDEEENDQLEPAWGLEPASRLACCVRIKEGDITVALPKHKRNHARENMRGRSEGQAAQCIGWSKIRRPLQGGLSFEELLVTSDNR